MFGNKLKELREFHKLTQEDFGKIFNLSRSTISKYEKNQLEPNINLIQNIINYFHVKANFFFSDNDKLIDDKHKDISLDINNLRRKLLVEEGLVYGDDLELTDETILVISQILELGDKIANSSVKKKK